MTARRHARVAGDLGTIASGVSDLESAAAIARSWFVKPIEVKEVLCFTEGAEDEARKQGAPFDRYDATAMIWPGAFGEPIVFTRHSGPTAATIRELRIAQLQSCRLTAEGESEMQKLLADRAAEGAS